MNNISTTINEGSLKINPITPELIESIVFEEGEEKYRLKKASHPSEKAIKIHGNYYYRDYINNKETSVIMLVTSDNSSLSKLITINSLKRNDIIQGINELFGHNYYHKHCTTKKKNQYYDNVYNCIMYIELYYRKKIDNGRYKWVQYQK